MAVVRVPIGVLDLQAALEGELLEDRVAVVFIESEGGPHFIVGGLAGEFAKQQAGRAAGRAGGRFGGGRLVTGLGRKTAENAGGEQGAFDGFHGFHGLHLMVMTGLCDNSVTNRVGTRTLFIGRAGIPQGGNCDKSVT